MKTIETSQLTAVYNPDERKIRFFNGGKLAYGLSGDLASQKMMECLRAGIPVTTQLKDETMEKKTLIKQFHAILAQKGLMCIKEDILMSCGVASTKDLTIEQLRRSVSQLNNAGTPERVRKERSTVLSLLDKLGIKGNSEIGWDRVNAYLSNPKIVGKPLYQLSLLELQRASVKLRAIIHKQKIQLT